jgi:hypothetical protein
MAITRHPIDSYDLKLNFWEEFPDYKLHPIFGEFWVLNKKTNLINSSNFMWILSLCYDRKSSIFVQPEVDKWEVSCDDVFNDKDFFIGLHTDPDLQDKVVFPTGVTLRKYISAFEESIDTPLGLSLRLLEAKLIERTDFIHGTPYSMDYYETTGAGRVITKKGTADQLDKMFAATDKINSLIQKAMDDLRNSEGLGTAKGGETESLGDGDKSF